MRSPPTIFSCPESTYPTKLKWSRKTRQKKSMKKMNLLLRFLYPVLLTKQAAGDFMLFIPIVSTVVKRLRLKLGKSLKGS